MVFSGYVEVSNTNCYDAHLSNRQEQDIQLVISDPMAFNNVVLKDRLIFDQAEAIR